MNKQLRFVLLSTLLYIGAAFLSNTCAQLPNNNQDCATKKAICGTTTVNDNNNGPGNTQDLKASNWGCFSAGSPAPEVNSSWYSFKIASSGTLTLSMAPSNGSDDYDFVIWGPNPACPPTAQPTRCSVQCYGNIAWCGGASAPAASTGLNMAATDVSEAPGSGDGWVKYLNALAGEEYILMVNNSTPPSTGFTMTFGGSAILAPCPILTPIKILSFKANPVGTSMKLSWETASESNNSYFEVQKSVEGKAFQPLTQITGAGNSTALSNYTCIDAHPVGGNNYYRLKQVSADGRYEYSATITANATGRSGSLSMKAYPNPADSKLQISLNGETANANIQLYDITGRCIWQMESVLQHEITIDLENFPQGIYWLSANNDTEIVSQKVIIKR